MKFVADWYVGQKRIVKELGILLEDVSKGINLNFIFRAPSGYGKTTLVLLALNILGFGKSAIYIPEDGILNMPFQDQLRFHFIDEVHTLKNPEFLYPLMDCGEYTFFFASNESGELKEPLRNRCIPFLFSQYTLEEMEDVVRNNLEIKLENEMITLIADRCRGTPRVAKIICTRLSSVFRNYLVPKNIDDLERILNELLYIREDGINQLDELYLQYLENIGGRASLHTLISGTRIDRTTILTEVEPHLLYLNRIRITSKGRELCSQ